MKNFLNYLFNLIYPPYCLVCKEHLPENSFLCEKCLAGIKFVKDTAHCKHCFYPLPAILKNQEVESCFNCRENNYLFLKNYSVAIYEGVVKEVIHLFKYNNKETLKIFLSKTMLNFAKKNIKENIEVISFVPLHRKRERQRGYNQAYLLAKSLSESLKVPLARNSLVKLREGAAQSSLNRKERVKNIKGAFTIKTNLSIKDKSVLLVDDVFTTGSTLNECARVLLKNGAKEVITFTAARA